MTTANEEQVTTKIITFMFTVHSVTPKPKIKELSRELSDLVQGRAERNEYCSCCFETYTDDITDEMNKMDAEQDTTKAA